MQIQVCWYMFTITLRRQNHLGTKQMVLQWCTKVLWFWRHQCPIQRLVHEMVGWSWIECVNGEADQIASAIRQGGQ